MSAYEPQQQESNGDVLSASARISIADTGAGLLVFEDETEYREHIGKRVVISKDLVGFADVDDWGVICDALRVRGLGVGATTNLPEFDLDELRRRGGFAQ